MEADRTVQSREHAYHERTVGQTTLTVPKLIDYLRAGGSLERLFLAFPELEPEDVRDAVDFAARNGYLK